MGEPLSKRHKSDDQLEGAEEVQTLTDASFQSSVQGSPSLWLVRRHGVGHVDGGNSRPRSASGRRGSV